MAEDGTAQSSNCDALYEMVDEAYLFHYYLRYSRSKNVAVASCPSCEVKRDFGTWGIHAIT
jgi:hypothetical protein